MNWAGSCRSGLSDGRLSPRCLREQEVLSFAKDGFFLWYSLTFVTVKVTGLQCQEIQTTHLENRQYSLSSRPVLRKVCMVAFTWRQATAFQWWGSVPVAFSVLRAHKRRCPKLWIPDPPSKHPPLTSVLLTSTSWCQGHRSSNNQMQLIPEAISSLWQHSETRDNCNGFNT